ncbi:hypothetical protein CKM354_000023600 [Cercospora kikuchii]|uniref:Uncharacterized protein n=1 Tax=Cercospora kikuchii TaxID=84275 RepID=A0A9P3C5F0_9PEZI|nr:uncharacterized protein CKM354_000023600 [Cercospora kikuchii]GIZ36769.1 hypothetical protein CKM354_000023600 [Cercospora kikuchii]
MSQRSGIAAASHPGLSATVAQPVSPPSPRPASPPTELGVANPTENLSAYTTTLDSNPPMMEAPSAGYWMEAPVPSQTRDGVGALGHQAYAPEEAASAQLLLDAIAPPSHASVAPFPSKGKRKAVIQDDEEEFLDPVLRKSGKRARLDAPSHQLAVFSESDDVEGGEFVVSSAWSSNDLKDWPPAHAWPLSIAFPDYQYNTQVPHDESITKSGFVNINTNL